MQNAILCCVHSLYVDFLIGQLNLMSVLTFMTTDAMDVTLMPSLSTLCLKLYCFGLVTRAFAMPFICMCESNNDHDQSPLGYTLPGTAPCHTPPLKLERTCRRWLSLHLWQFTEYSQLIIMNTLAMHEASSTNMGSIYHGSHLSSFWSCLVCLQL